MLIISQNASNYNIPFPEKTVYRINLAWVNSIKELDHGFFSSSNSLTSSPLK